MKRQAIGTHVILLGVAFVLGASLTGCLSQRPAATVTPPGQTPATAAAAAPSPIYWPTRGWRTSSPAEQGMDAARLTSMLESVASQKLPLHSLLVIRNGVIVSETYFASYGPGDKHELYSCTKSFISTLVGIAIDKGAIAGVGQPVSSFFPGRAFANPSAAKESMTLEHLLTMTSGLDWAEGDPTYREMAMSRDWVGYVMDLPMRTPPGSQFGYCSGCSHVLSAIVQEKTGMNTRKFAEQELFGPLGITDFRWDTDAQGIPIGGWGLQLTPRDMAKLGYLYLRGGVWDGRQIVSAQWVKSATERHTKTEEELGYGYQWWTYPRWGAYTATGRYGQTIFVIPSLDLVIVVTAAVDRHDAIYQLIEQYIVPAVRSS